MHAGGFVGLGAMDAALEAIAASPDGLLAGIAPGTVWVDMSTVGPSASAALRGRAPLVLDLAETSAARPHA